MIETTAHSDADSLTIASRGGINQGEKKRADESKSKRGGKREGAGRKPNLFKRLGLKAPDAQRFAEAADAPDLWDYFLHHRNPRIRLDAWKYLLDRAYGRPKQALEMSGGVAHVHYRDPILANLTPAELDQLDKLTRKLSAPVLEASPNGPHNQIESKPAIEAEAVESETVRA